MPFEYVLYSDLPDDMSFWIRFLFKTTFCNQKVVEQTGGGWFGCGEGINKIANFFD